MNVVIIEDELLGRKSLIHLLEKAPQEITVLGAYETVDSAIPIITKEQPDIIFLDIKLPQKNGFYLFEYFKGKAFKSHVIITTAYNQYALQALQLSAIDYLLKPIDLDGLIEAIDKVKDQLKVQKNQELYFSLKENLFNNKKTLAIPKQSGLVFIQLNEIIYCEADGNYTVFYLKSGERHIVTRQLKYYDKLLVDFNFFRPNRSYLINFDHLRALNKGKKTYIIMCDDKEILISSLKKQEFFDNFLGE